MVDLKSDSIRYVQCCPISLTQFLHHVWPFFEDRWRFLKGRRIIQFDIAPSLHPMSSLTPQALFLSCSLVEPDPLVTKACPLSFPEDWQPFSLLCHYFFKMLHQQLFTRKFLCCRPVFLQGRAYPVLLPPHCFTWLLLGWHSFTPLFFMLITCQLLVKFHWPQK